MLVAAIVLLLGLAFVLVPRMKRQNHELVEGAHLTSIHQGWLLYARETIGQLPVPGAVRRRSGPAGGAGQGAIDDGQNTTAHVYSMTIMLNYFTPELCVGPAEPSPHVRVARGADAYDFDAYAPLDGVHWDPNFRADLHDVSHVSYAHLPLWGVRFEEQWRDAADPGFPLLGHRGPKNGADPSSVTLRIFPPPEEWRGLVVHADNSTAMNTTMTRGEFQVEVDGQFVPDHLFRFDEGALGADAMITFTKAMNADGPATQWD